MDAISCLTEEDHFHGNTDYLKYIRSMTSLPILRKDFMIDEYQFYEAKAIGADAVLLIAAILDDTQMKAFYELDTTRRLSQMVPKEKVFVAESGITTDADVRFLKQCRVDAFLIGRALMETEHPAEVVSHWKELT